MPNRGNALTRALDQRPRSLINSQLQTLPFLRKEAIIASNFPNASLRNIHPVKVDHQIVDQGNRENGAARGKVQTKNNKVAIILVAKFNPWSTANKVALRRRLGVWLPNHTRDQPSFRRSVKLPKIGAIPMIENEGDEALGNVVFPA